jgi:hypothetical protein
MIFSIIPQVIFINSQRFSHCYGAPKRYNVRVMDAHEQKDFCNRVIEFRLRKFFGGVARCF